MGLKFFEGDFGTPMIAEVRYEMEGCLAGVSPTYPYKACGKKVTKQCPKCFVVLCDEHIGAHVETHKSIVEKGSGSLELVSVRVVVHTHRYPCELCGGGLCEYHDQ